MNSKGTGKFSHPAVDACSTVRRWKERCICQDSLCGAVVTSNFNLKERRFIFCDYSMLVMCKQDFVVLTPESRLMEPLPDGKFPVIVAQGLGHSKLCSEFYSFCLVVTYVTSTHISLAKHVLWSYQLHRMMKNNPTMSLEITVNHNRREGIDERGIWVVELIEFGGKIKGGCLG